MTSETPTEIVRRLIPPVRHAGYPRPSATSRGGVDLRLDFAPELCTAGGVLHGGVVMALADSSGALCAFLNLPEAPGGTATIESKTTFLGAIREGEVTATSRPLHAGARTIVVETEVHAADGRLAARVIQTQGVL